MSLDGALVDALDALARTDVLLVALDFDGVLAPLVDRPEDSRMLPASRDAIVALSAAQRTSVALVSGRYLENLRAVSEAPDGVLLYGSHGAEADLGDGGAGELLTDGEREALERLGAVVDDVAGRHPLIRVEVKPTGYTVHTRGVEAAAADAALADAESGVASLVPGVRMRPGKDVLEFSVLHATKGDAIERLREHVGATAALYAGDDVTDEDAFAVLRRGDVGVKVGEGDTAALHRVGAPEDVAEMLGLLSSARIRETGHGRLGPAEGTTA